MLRCVRLWTGQDGNSRFEEGLIDLPGGERGDVLSGNVPAVSISFRETTPGGSFNWHDAPARQFVLMLAGTLEFEIHDGSRFTISPGEILFAEDTTGSGHKWRLIDNSPWRRAYVILQPGANVPFVRKSAAA
jgi:quercetin dioxygenase-like cupin family protein